jgi:phosphoglycerol transferase MdoB-like AlkP superfamily enzyme
VIIAAESLSRHYVRGWNPRVPEGTTPFLDSLAEKYPSVENYWAGAMPTEEAIYSILMSRPLYDIDSVAGGRLSPLFASLRAGGFRSFIVRGHSHFFQDAVSLYPRLYGPDAFIAAEEMAGGARTIDFDWGFRDGEVLRETARLLDRERGAPVIALVSLMDTHPPYNYETPEKGFPPEVADSGSRLLRSVHSTDRALESFFGELEERGLFDDKTLVIVTSDHRPTYGDAAEFLDSEDHMSWRIPLIFVLKGGRERLDFAPGVSGSHLDLGPTLLGLLGLPAPENWWGRSLLEPGRKGMGVGSADDFILAQSPDLYFWILYTDALGPPPPGDPARVRAFKKWVHNKLLGTTGRVDRQKFDERKKRWERFSL